MGHRSGRQEAWQYSKLPNASAPFTGLSRSAKNAQKNRQYCQTGL
ncbi:Uncharacterised protein [Vibrio cholerae]|nr:Uncharacterised protein [Vibrio cholerae]